VLVRTFASSLGDSTDNNLLSSSDVGQKRVQYSQISTHRDFDELKCICCDWWQIFSTQRCV